VSVTENIDETPSGLLLHGIMSSIAEFYSRNLATEVVKGMNQKAKNGGTIGLAPIGYCNVRRIVNGREERAVEVDEERAPLIRWAFEQYATGEWTLRGLLAELTARGLTTRPGPNRPSRPVTLSRFNNLLRSVYYIGQISYRGAVYEGRHQALIDRATFEEVQRVLESHNAITGLKQRTHNHYLKGTVFCGECHSRLSLMYVTNRYGTRYPYFFCLGKQSGRTQCSQPVIRIDRVEEKVEEEYRKVQMAPEFAGTVRSFVQAAIEQQRAEAEAVAQKQLLRRERLQNEREKLLQAHYAEAIPIQLLKKEQGRIQRELDEVERLLAASQLEVEKIEENLARTLKLLSDCRRAYREADSKTKRLFNQAFFDWIRIDEDYTTEAQLAEPFRTLKGQELAKVMASAGATGPKTAVYHRARLRPAADWGLETANPPLISLGMGFSDVGLVRVRGLEPPRPCGHMALNHACLPISAHPLR